MRLVASKPMARTARTRVLAGLPAWLLAGLVACAWVGFSSFPAHAGEGEAPAVEAPEPAIPVPDEPPAEAEPEWSYRFLVPATLLLGTAAVVGAIIMYFVRVTRNRYRVIK